MKTRLNKDELTSILSMGEYWEEVAQRDSCSTPIGEILSQELGMVWGKIGLKLLWVLLDYAKEQKEEEITLDTIKSLGGSGQ